MGAKIEKSHGGAPPGPRGGAEAGERSDKKVRDTQGNPRYSAKNNVAMRMISPFMPNIIEYLFPFSEHNLTYFQIL